MTLVFQNLRDGGTFGRSIKCTVICREDGERTRIAKRSGFQTVNAS